MIEIKTRWDVAAEVERQSKTLYGLGTDTTFTELLLAASYSSHFQAVVLGDTDIVPNPEDAVVAASYTLYEPGEDASLSVKNFVPDFPEHLTHGKLSTLLAQGALSMDYAKYEQEKAAPSLKETSIIIDHLPYGDGDWSSDTILLGGIEHRKRYHAGPADEHQYYSALLLRKDLSERLMLLGDIVRFGGFEGSTQTVRTLAHFTFPGLEQLSANKLANGIAKCAFQSINLVVLDDIQMYNPQIAAFN